MHLWTNNKNKLIEDLILNGKSVYMFILFETFKQDTLYKWNLILNINHIESIFINEFNKNWYNLMNEIIHKHLMTEVIYWKYMEGYYLSKHILLALIKKEFEINYSKQNYWFNIENMK